MSGQDFVWGGGGGGGDSNGRAMLWPMGEGVHGGGFLPQKVKKLLIMCFIELWKELSEVIYKRILDASFQTEEAHPLYSCLNLGIGTKS